MSRQLQIGHGLTLPLDAVTESFAIVGRRGSGKTHTAVVMAEEMIRAGVPIVVADPLDVWWGLRVGKDGKSAGRPIYIAGGSHADIPLHADAGRVLADAIVDRALSIVLSVRHLSKTDQRRFVGDLCERLYDRKADPKHRTAMHVFIDEADAFVPQRLMPGSERCFGAVDTLVRRGRSSGLAATLISQRPQVVNKDVLSQTEVLVCHQLTGPQDRKALDAWIQANDTDDRRDEFMGSLASLPKGRAWFWSPGLLGIFTPVTVRDRETFDSSATPKAGVRVTASPKAFAAVDLQALTADIAASIAKAKADDPRELRKEIAGLKKQLEVQAAIAKQTKPLKAAAVRLLEKPVVRDAQIAALDKAIARLDAVVERAGVLLSKPFAGVRDAIAGLTAAVKTVRQPTLPLADPLKHVEVADKRIALGQSPAAAALLAPSADVRPGGERAILTAIAQHAPDGVTRDQLTILTGYKKSTRDAYLQRLIAKGQVQNHGPCFHATAAGRDALGPDFEPLPTGDALREHWRSRLNGGELQIFAAVTSFYPNAIDRDEISTRTGYKKSTRDAYIQRLAARRLLIVDRGTVRASEALFG